MESRPPAIDLPGDMVFLALSGSHAYGLATPDSDEDWRGVFQASTHALLGFTRVPETVTALPDITCWELGHFCRMLLRGNPNIIELLWLEPRFIATTSPVITRLRDLRSELLSAPMSEAYFGWIKREYLEITDPTKPGLDARLESKRASHLVRLLFSFRHAVRDHRLVVTLTGDEREMTYAVKRGKMKAADVLRLLDDLTAECRTLYAADPFAAPPTARVERILLDARAEKM